MIASLVKYWKQLESYKTDQMVSVLQYSYIYVCIYVEFYLHILTKIFNLIFDC